MRKNLNLEGTPALVTASLKEFFDNIEALGTQSLTLDIQLESAAGPKSEMISMTGTLVPVIVTVLARHLEALAQDASVLKLVVTLETGRDDQEVTMDASRPEDRFSLIEKVLGDMPDKEKATAYIQFRLKKILARSRVTRAAFASESLIICGYLSQILDAKKGPSLAVVGQMLGTIYALSLPGVTKPFHLRLSKDDEKAFLSLRA